MIRFPFYSISLLCLCCWSSTAIIAQQIEPEPAVHEERKGLSRDALSNFQLSSSLLTNGDSLPGILKCTRHGGDGLSPPLEWTGAPDGTGQFVIIMQHYPRGKSPGVDTPSHYWLVWDIPASATGVEQGNPDSLGNEGSDKDRRGTGYTPPCSPSGGGTHTYTITVYAVDGSMDTLPESDDATIVWGDIIAALKGHVLNADSINFTD